MEVLHIIVAHDVLILELKVTYCVNTNCLKLFLHVAI